jgi:hypothetical protein
MLAGGKPRTSKGTEMPRTILVTLVLVAGVAVGATALREPVARAAKKVPSFFIANDSSTPVPVRGQNGNSSAPIKPHGTAKVNVTNTIPGPAAGGPLAASGTATVAGTTIEIDSPTIHLDGGSTFHYRVHTSRFAEIRVSVTCLGGCQMHGNADGAGASIKFVDAHGNDLYSGDDIHFGEGDPPWNTTLDLPGTTMDVVLSADESSKSFEVVVWGR